MNYCRYLEETGTINPRQVILRNNKQFLELNCLRIGENSPSPRLSYRIPPILSTISIPPPLPFRFTFFTLFVFPFRSRSTDDGRIAVLRVGPVHGHGTRREAIVLLRSGNVRARIRGILLLQNDAAQRRLGDRRSPRDQRRERDRLLHGSQLPGQGAIVVVVVVVVLERVVRQQFDVLVR